MAVIWTSILPLLGLLSNIPYTDGQLKLYMPEQETEKLLGK